MRVLLSRRSIREEVAALDSPLVEDERPQLAELIRALQRAGTPPDFYRLQEALRRRFFVFQRTLGELRSEVAASGTRLRRLTSLEEKPLAAIRQTQAVLGRQKLAERAIKMIMHALRCVGDGIAWKTLHYDRAVLSVLGQGRPVGRLADGQGLDAELAAIAGFWRLGTFAIHNDLTNCLRTGDLTLPFAAQGVEIHEVKAGTSHRSAQIEKASSRIEFLQRGRGRWEGSQREARLVRYATPYKTHLASLQSVVASAGNTGFAATEAAPGLWVGCADLRIGSAIEGRGVFGMAEKIAEEAAWDDAHSLLWTTTMLRRMRERTQYIPYLAPLTIFPLEPVAISELLLGPREYVTVLNGPMLERTFAAQKMQAEVVTSGPERSKAFLRVNNGIASIELPPVIGEQMLTELMDPACLRDGVREALGGVVAGQPPASALSCWSNEPQVWSRAGETPAA